MLESNCHVQAHMTPPTVFKLWPLHGTPLFPSISRLSHIITIYYIYIIIISSNAHLNSLIEASIPRLHQFHTSYSKPSKALLQLANLLTKLLIRNRRNTLYSI
jgi:hypothetical protein